MNSLKMHAGLALLLLGGCSKAAPVLSCPDPAAVLPTTIGTGFVSDLTGRLAGPDRQNSITEAITEIHRLAPALGSAGVTDILVAADCPNALTRPDRDPSADRARIAAFRAQVDQLLAN